MTPEQRKILTKHSPEGWTPGTQDALPELMALERERCAKIAEGFVMTGPSPIGPLHGAGWSDAATRIAAEIRKQQ